jgi:hypothetical protein
LYWLETGLAPGSHTVKVRWNYTTLGYYVDQRGATDGKRTLIVIGLP